MLFPRTPPTSFVGPESRIWRWLLAPGVILLSILMIWVISWDPRSIGIVAMIVAVLAVHLLLLWGIWRTIRLASTERFTGVFFLVWALGTLILWWPIGMFASLLQRTFTDSAVVYMTTAPYAFVEAPSVLLNTVLGTLLYVVKYAAWLGILPALAGLLLAALVTRATSTWS